MQPTALQKAVTQIYLDYTLKFPRQAQTEENLQRKAALDANHLPGLSGLDVLEVGPGAGQLAKLMTSRGANVSVLDLIDTYIDQLGEVAVEAFVEDIQSPFVSNRSPRPHSYDLVTMCDVLEHVVRPGDALIAAAELLKPSGLLYVRSPSWETLAKYALGRGCEAEMAHLRTYTPELLDRELHDAGFRVIASGVFWSHVEPKLFWIKVLGRSWVRGNVRKLLLAVLHGNSVPGLSDSVVKFFQRAVTRPGECWALARPR